MVLFLNYFSYPSEDQAMYDEERQVQRVHVNSNAEESSQYQTYSQSSQIATSSGKQLDRSLTFKKRGRPKKNEDDDVNGQTLPPTLLLIFGKHKKYYTMLNTQSTIYGKKIAVPKVSYNRICLNKVMSLQQPRYPANFFLWKTTFAKKGEKLRQALRKAVAERINFIKVNGDFMSA